MRDNASAPTLTDVDADRQSQAHADRPAHMTFYATRASHRDTGDGV